MLVRTLIRASNLREKSQKDVTTTNFKEWHLKMESERYYSVIGLNQKSFSS